MTTNPKPAYQRILLKLSGEALQGEEGFGIDPTILDRMASRSKRIVLTRCSSRCCNRWW